jgi:hypothetical protein
MPLEETVMGWLAPCAAALFAYFRNPVFSALFHSLPKIGAGGAGDAVVVQGSAEDVGPIG